MVELKYALSMMHQIHFDNNVSYVSLFIRIAHLRHRYTSSSACIIDDDSVKCTSR